MKLSLFIYFVNIDLTPAEHDLWPWVDRCRRRRIKLSLLWTLMVGLATCAKGLRWRPGSGDLGR